MVEFEIGEIDSLAMADRCWMELGAQNNMVTYRKKL
jgi:hypothetical protein